MDSIDQATHITGRDLRKELLKKSDGIIRNTLSMMEGSWSDDDVIAKLHQDFSSLSTMNRAREELKSLYQEQGEPITDVHLQIWPNAYSLHRYQGREGNPPICNHWIYFSIGASTQQGCSQEVHGCQKQTSYAGGCFPVNRTLLQEDAGGQFIGSEFCNKSTFKFE